MAAPKYIKNVSGVLTEQAASETSAAEVIVATSASGLLDISFMPTGIGPDIVTVLASETITGGQLVNLYNNAGTLNVRKADGSTTGKDANGFCLVGITSGASGAVYMGGINTAVTGLTPGKIFLSDTTAGAVTNTAPTTAGHTVQQVGVALSATSLQFEPQIPITLA